jgi:hypothetical protein
LAKRRVGSRKVNNKRFLMPVERDIPGMDEEAAAQINAEVAASNRVSGTSDVAIRRLEQGGLFPLKANNGLN